MKRSRTTMLPALILIALAIGVPGCSPQPTSSVLHPATDPVRPAVADLSTPDSAVLAYLDWTSYAYRIGSSDAASQTMSAQEEVRVNSYVQLNRERKRRIAQVLVSFKPRAPSIDTTRAALGADEVWSYRYLSDSDARAISETLTASYETTYNLVRVAPATWAVDSVEARPRGAVK